jgi:hypothetical protein
MEIGTMITLDLESAIAGCRRVERRLREIANVMDHAEDLMEHWRRLMEEGNLRGVLAGTDGDGNPLKKVTYRPRDPRKLTVGERLGQRTNKRRGQFAGSGNYDQYKILPNNNLSSSAYRRLDGPPLAPRRQFSRVVTNFKTTTFQMEEHGSWVVIGTWDDVVSPSGYHFLPDLFATRNLRGVRPDDLAKIKATILPWAKLVVRELWQGTD